MSSLLDDYEKVVEAVEEIELTRENIRTNLASREQTEEEKKKALSKLQSIGDELAPLRAKEKRLKIEIEMSE